MEQQPQAAEAQATEPVEAVERDNHAVGPLRHPFDPETSGKNPFPAFEESMAQTKADEDDDEEEEVNAEASSGRVDLNWSIDSLATLKPMDFSPLPEQKAAAVAGAAGLTTPDTTQHSRFFEDEAQFRVLQTPSDAAQQQQQKPSLSATRRRAPASTPETNSSSSSVLLSAHLPRTPLHELHARCRQAITFHEERLRERQHKMNRLQLPLHTPARAKKKPKQAPTRSTNQNSTPSFPQRSSRTSFSASPASASVSGPSFQCGLSPIPAFNRASPSRDFEEQEEEETKTSDNDDALSCIERNTSSPEGPSFASLMFSPSEDEDDKENRRRQPRSVSFAPSSSTSSPLPSSTDPSLDRSLSLLADVTPEKQRPMTIAQRQRSFLDAIEAEAMDKRAISPPPLTADEPKSSPVALNVLGSSAKPSGKMTIPELYQEAKTLGISEPSAQWEYVQIMTRQR